LKDFINKQGIQLPRVLLYLQFNLPKVEIHLNPKVTNIFGLIEMPIEIELFMTLTLSERSKAGIQCKWFHLDVINERPVRIKIK